MLLATLGFIAVMITFVMFLTKERLLGFPCAIFWALASGQAYVTSAATWDIYYLVFFGTIGMAIFSMYAMYALNKNVVEEWDDKEKYADEDKKNENVTSAYGKMVQDNDFTETGDGFETKAEANPRVSALRGRAKERRSRLLSGKKKNRKLIRW